MLRPRVSIDTASIDRYVRSRTEKRGEEARELLERMGREMVIEVVNIVQSEYPNNYRHKPNTTHLDESFMYKVERGSGPGGFPYTLALTIKPGVSAGKIGALNYGVEPRSTDYYIRPRNVPRALRFQPGTFDPALAKQSGKYAGQALRTQAHRIVVTGPREGGQFMERARDIVMARYGFVGE